MIRKHILSLTEPFCISDLFHGFKSKGISDRDLILDNLDDLYNQGLVEYRCTNHPNSKWAFVVV